ncbi:MAG: sulfatase-like hydrolase/transferase [Marinifilaceae bacterium]
MNKLILRFLLLFLLLANLIPNFIFLFTENYTFTQSIISIILPLSLFSLLFVVIRRVGVMQLLLIPFYALCGFQLVVLYLFGECPIAVDMLLNLPTTNATEASELLNNLWPAIILVLFIYVPVIAIAIFLLSKRIYLAESIRQNVCKYASIGMGVAILLLLFNPDSFYIRQDVYPFNVFNNVYIAMDKWDKSENYAESSASFHFHARKANSVSDREVYILVIGEASRADNWQLNGYQRETNPNLSRRSNLYYFQDALTQSNTTHKSVPLILSHIDAANINNLHKSKSIISAMNEVGFTTLFLSNQTPNRSYTDYFAETSHIHKNIRSGNLITSNAFDMTLVDSCIHYIEHSSENLFIVLHTYGSHFRYEERYPTQFAHFKPDVISNIKITEREALINSYDNSIRYTDHVLDSLLTYLHASDICSALLYTADHGEDLLDDDRKRFLHASPYPTYYQVHIPFMLWFSEKFINHFPNKISAVKENLPKAVSTSNVFHTLMDMASVQCEHLQPHNSLLYPGYINQQRYYLSDSDEAQPFNACGLKKVDLSMMKKHNICLDLNTIY